MRAQRPIVDRPDSLPAGPFDPQAQKLLEAVLRRHAGFHDFETSFTQTPVSRATGQGDQESGTVSFMKPDRWRWDYRSPERKLVIVRGKTAALKIEGDEDVSRYDLSGGEAGSSSVGSLIAGGEAVAKAFQASFLPGESGGSGGEVVLRLEPAEVSEQFDHVLLTVRPKTLAIVELTIVDPGGNGLRFRFGEFRIDSGLRESVFAWPEPSGRPSKPGP